MLCLNLNKKENVKKEILRKDIQIMVPLIYLSNVWETLEIGLEIFLNW